MDGQLQKVFERGWKLRKNGKAKLSPNWLRTLKTLVQEKNGFLL